MHRHILSVSQFDRRFLDELLAHADQLRALPRSAQRRRRGGSILATVFYEPSTRTRLSFESAMTRLGGSVLSVENANETSSAVKGESIEDTARIIAGYADAIVMRHPEAGVPSRAAKVVDVPVINAGDGAREHPTQSLLDLYTLKRELGRIDGLRIALVGDLKYGRAPRSLAMLMTQTQGCELVFVAPPGIGMLDDVTQALDGAGVSHRAETNLLAALPSVDAVYQTRIQKERFSSAAEYEAARGHYIIDQRAMDALNPRAIVLHPLPRVDEIDPAVDADPRAAYFRQAENGVYARMALLDMLLS
jgi:aspartate carbamoyltransferase catalytic subunit